MKTKKPLGITCDSRDCKNGLHCFRVTATRVSEHPEGSCQGCGAKTVNWERVHQKKETDVENTFAALGTERVRNFFMNLPLSARAVNYARRKGRIQLEAAIRKRLTSAIGSATPFRDGWQTPMTEDDPNPLHNAQHATATCCRRCLEYWHGIPRGRDLSNDEVDYLTFLIAKYLDEKIPDLVDQPVPVPRIAKS